MVTQRNVALCIIFTIITCGIYGLYWFVVLTDDTNTLADEMGTSGVMALIFTIITCGIYGFYWAYKRGELLDRVKANKGRYTMNIRKHGYAWKITLLMLSVFLVGSITACQPQKTATELTKSLKRQTVTGKTADDEFKSRFSDFSIDLFQKSIKEKENSMVSPLSVLLALAMTANGAEGETLSEMEQFLGGTIPLDELNEYLYSYSNYKDIHIANSIWFRDKEGLLVNEDFLQKNMDYYAASIFKAPFDAVTVQEINGWVKDQTDGMIEEILNEIGDQAVIFLINAIAFEAEWEKVYHKEDVREGEFTDIDGNISNIPFMLSDESLYLKDDEATGFIKPYAGGSYSFAALMPNKGVELTDYIRTMSGEKWTEMIEGAESTLVEAALPKFSFSYEIQLNEILRSAGIERAFHPQEAEFGEMAISDVGNIFIQEVLHKTFISVDELGTRAGAVTKVEKETTSAPEKKSVILDKPFLYAVIDNSTNIPVFIGTVVNMEK